MYVTKNMIIFNDYEIQETGMHHAMENKQIIFRKRCYKWVHSLREYRELCIIHHIGKIRLKCNVEWRFNEAVRVDVGKMQLLFDVSYELARDNAHTLDAYK